MFNYNTDTNVNESEFEDLRCIDEITDVETLNDLMGVPVILNRHKGDMESLMKRTVDIAGMCWSNPDRHGDTLEHTRIPFKVSVDQDTTYSMPLNGFMFFLLFVNPIINYIEDIKIEDFIFDCPLIEKERNSIINKIRLVMQQFGHPMDEIRQVVSDIMLYISELNRIFGQACIQVFTTENLFLDHYRESEIIREINNTRYPSNIQTAEIVEENAKRYAILRDEMIKRKNPLFIDDQFTKILKPKQIEELYIHFGQIPDGKNIINVVMNGNGFNDGYRDMDVVYAAAIAARVPDIMNEEYMGPAGYFARNLWILTYGSISPKVTDCGSRNPIPIVVDEVTLKMFDGRYYYEHKHDGILKMFHSTDRHLLGRQLWFRSPCTCNLNNDVCHYCYGNAALRVKDFSGGFICTTQFMTARINQNVLSAKHLLRANAELIVFTENFEKYFEIDSCQVAAKEDKKFDIYIREDYLDDISEKFEMFIGKTLEPVTIGNYANINISDEVFSKAKMVVIDDVSYYKINSSKILDYICLLTPINIMMTAKYTKMMRLLDNDIVKYDDISSVVSELYHLFDGIIPLLSTHGEIIIGSLIRNAEDVMKRPNWLNIDEPYQMVRVKTALSNTDSFTAALASEQTNHHLRHAVFDKRNKINKIGARNFIDYLFGYAKNGTTLGDHYRSIANSTSKTEIDEIIRSTAEYYKAQGKSFDDMINTSEGWME